MRAISRGYDMSGSALFCSTLSRWLTTGCAESSNINPVCSSMASTACQGYVCMSAIPVKQETSLNTRLRVYII